MLKIDGISPKIENFPWVQGTAGYYNSKPVAVVYEHVTLNGDGSWPEQDDKIESKCRFTSKW